MKTISFLLTCTVLFWALGCDLVKQEFPCENVKCRNKSICIDGKCRCARYFGGDSCTIMLDSCALRPCIKANTDDCNGNFCFCKQGYEGTFCQFLSSTKFLGRPYNVIDTCGNRSFQMNIRLAVGDTSATTPLKLQLRNFMPNVDFPSLEGDSLVVNVWADSFYTTRVQSFGINKINSLVGRQIIGPAGDTSILIIYQKEKRGQLPVTCRMTLTR